MKKSMRLLVDDGLEYAYTVRGPAAPETPAAPTPSSVPALSSAQPALLLHGFTGCGANWLGLAHDLEQQYRLILPDLLGHGQSSAPAEDRFYRMEVAAAHLAALVDEAAGGPVHLLGYSMGGRLALYFALVYPARVRSLALESASPGLETAPERDLRRQADEALAARILNGGMDAFVAYWEALPLFASQADLPAPVKADLHRQRLSNRPEGLAGSLCGMGTGAQPELWSRLGELGCPVLLIAGERDIKFKTIAQRMATKIPSARLAVIPQAGHTTHLEQPRLFSQQVLAFWSQRPVQNIQFTIL